VKHSVKKRSIAVAGRHTSISLEDEFWQSLRIIARRRGETLSQLLVKIEGDRQSTNLSSAIRLFVLRYYRDQQWDHSLADARTFEFDQVRHAVRASV